MSLEGKLALVAAAPVAIAAPDAALFPDTPNQPAFGSARLNLGQTYRNVMIYRLSSGQAKTAVR